MLAGFLHLNEWCWDALGYPAADDHQGPADHSLNPTKLASMYRQWNADAESWLKQKQIKVLKFKATDGWGPLCNFLSPKPSPLRLYSWFSFAPRIPGLKSGQNTDQQSGGRRASLNNRR